MKKTIKINLAFEMDFCAVELEDFTEKDFLKESKELKKDLRAELTRLVRNYLNGNQWGAIKVDDCEKV